MPVRVTPEQLSLLQRNVDGKPVLRAPSAPRVKKRRQDLPENIVTKQITDLLLLRGWTLSRQQVGFYVSYREYRAALEGKRSTGPPIRIGEEGMTDWRAERVIIPPGRRASQGPYLSEVLYIEIKRPGAKPSPKQQLWISRKASTGVSAEWFDSVEEFNGWYWRRYGLRAGDPPKER